MTLLAAVGVTVTPACQEKNQEGAASTVCLDQTITVSAVSSTFTFAACCRPDGKCGGFANTLEVGDPVNQTLQVDLGCVAADSLPDPVGPTTCTP